ncbi:hypothetical protein KHP60_16045 [Microvirga sp. 3-52]|uniref:hypothetical protein n=1 Tax=Microvirga sp. 3-52 TaxID=2792425 RepID=UPI001AC17A0E|nr:hypothetical protein [Microvirga sp. 3-52]MBO1906559.1 hypothetical protein [Microvirga sp. 3-52]MBS7453843.1 hypothetical protein [Microvirga sp. 3-52]
MREIENALFDRWVDHRYPGFLKDGAGKDFASQSFRIVYLLKEAVCEPATDPLIRFKWWDYRDFMNGGGQAATWNNLSRWTAHLLDGASYGDVADMRKEQRTRLQRRIAAVNLKKIPGTSTSDMSEIEHFALEDAQFLREQLSIYRPDLIVACGTFEIAERVLNLTPADRVKWGERHFHRRHPDFGVLTSFWHPQSRLSKKKLFRSFTEMVAALKADGMLMANSFSSDAA